MDAAVDTGDDLRDAPSRGRVALVVIAVLVLAWVGMLLTQAVLVGVGLTLGLGDTGTLVRDPGILGGAQLLGLLPALAIGRRALPAPRRAASAPPVTLELIVVAVILGASLQFVLGALTGALGTWLPAFRLDVEAMQAIEETLRVDSVARAFAVPFCVVLAAPLSEELLFRGTLLPALRGHFGLVAGIGGSALLFGLFHLHPASIVYATLAGLVLGAVAHRSGSIRPSFALHAGFNGIPILLTRDVVPIPGFNTGGDTDQLPGMLLVSTGMLAVAMLLWLARLTEPRRAGRIA